MSPRRAREVIASGRGFAQPAGDPIHGGRRPREHVSNADRPRRQETASGYQTPGGQDPAGDLGRGRDMERCGFL